MTTTSVTGLHMNLKVLNIHVQSKAMKPPITIETTTVYKKVHKILRTVTASMPSLPDVKAAACSAPSSKTLPWIKRRQYQQPWKEWWRLRHWPYLSRKWLRIVWDVQRVWWGWGRQLSRWHWWWRWTWSWVQLIGLLFSRVFRGE